MQRLLSNMDAMHLQLAPFLPVGFIGWTGQQAAPQGWLICDGSAISRSVYAELYAAIGTTFGSGDGSTTFNLPNILGNFIRGIDKGRGKDLLRVFGSEQADALQGHWHNTESTGAIGSGSIVAPVSSYNTDVTPRTTLTGVFASAPISDGTNGTPRTAAETRPVNIALTPIIKAKNIVGFDPATAGANADTLDNLHAAAFALLGGSASQLFQVAAGVGSNDAVNMGQMAISTAANGYQKLPSGLIIQWGVVSTTTSGISSALPIAFPHAGLSFAACPQSSTPSYYPQIGGYLSSNSTIWLVASGSPVNVFYMVVGY